MGLSPAVEAAIDQAVNEIEITVTRIIDGKI